MIDPTRRTGELDCMFGPTRPFGELDGSVNPTRQTGELDGVVGPTCPFCELDGMLDPTRQTGEFVGESGPTHPFGELDDGCFAVRDPLSEALSNLSRRLIVLILFGIITFVVSGGVESTSAKETDLQVCSGESWDYGRAAQRAQRVLLENIILASLSLVLPSTEILTLLERMMRRRICVLPALDEMVDQDAYMKMVVPSNEFAVEMENYFAGLPDKEEVACNLLTIQNLWSELKAVMVKDQERVSEVNEMKKKLEMRRNLAKEYEGVLIRVKDKFEKKKVEVLAEILSDHSLHDLDLPQISDDSTNQVASPSHGCFWID
ncbi:hypothetical protein F2Q69_00048607 [Brassica cretica]|uniref:Uncharacterized protein n=1 Tax=Brassica cretica TaxID=69181 RepID=A0A8S9PY04_BRACR|nr:hypothetical protein F2Q69_00048607 [Brassica cretica]